MPSAGASRTSMIAVTTAKTMSPTMGNRIAISRRSNWPKLPSVVSSARADVGHEIIEMVSEHAATRGRHAESPRGIRVAAHALCRSSGSSPACPFAFTGYRRCRSPPCLLRRGEAEGGRTPHESNYFTLNRISGRKSPDHERRCVASQQRLLAGSGRAHAASTARRRFQNVRLDQLGLLNASNDQLGNAHTAADLKCFGAELIKMTWISPR